MQLKCNFNGVNNKSTSDYLGVSGIWHVRMCYDSISLRALLHVARRSFGLAWGLMAGLPGFASHGGGSPSRSWLPKVEAPGCPWYPTST